MPGIDGGTLRAWRRSRGWEVPEVAGQLRYAARESAVHVAAHAGLIRKIYAWEWGDLAAIAVTERKASLLIDVARAFFQWGRYEQAYAALRAAEQTAPEEVAARPAVCALAGNLAALAPPGIRRDAEQFASRIGAAR